jgi:hypothetical protein
MKGKPVLPGGPLASKPTCLNAFSRRSSAPAFSAFTVRCEPEVDNQENAPKEICEIGYGRNHSGYFLD